MALEDSAKEMFYFQSLLTMLTSTPREDVLKESWVEAFYDPDDVGTPITEIVPFYANYALTRRFQRWVFFHLFCRECVQHDNSSSSSSSALGFSYSDFL